MKTMKWNNVVLAMIASVSVSVASAEVIMCPSSEEIKAKDMSNASVDFAPGGLWAVSEISTSAPMSAFVIGPYSLSSQQEVLDQAANDVENLSGPTSATAEKFSQKILNKELDFYQCTYTVENSTVRGYWLQMGYGEDADNDGDNSQARANFRQLLRHPRKH